MNKYKKFIRRHKEIKAWDERGLVGHWMKYGSGWIALVLRIGDKNVLRLEETK